MMTIISGHEVLFDREDLFIIAEYPWRLTQTTPIHLPYIRAYRKTKDKYTMYTLHRIIMGAEKGQIVDHINGNTFDNRRSNLRFVTASQNQYNKAPNKNRRHTNYKGVNFCGDKPRPNPWQAKIRVNGKLKHIGCFKTPEEAYYAYCKKALEIQGEYARLK